MVRLWSLRVANPSPDLNDMRAGWPWQPSQNVIPSEGSESKDPLTSPENAKNDTGSGFGGSTHFGLLGPRSLRMTATVIVSTTDLEGES